MANIEENTTLIKQVSERGFTSEQRKKVIHFCIRTSKARK